MLIEIFSAFLCFKNPLVVSYFVQPSEAFLFRAVVALGIKNRRIIL